MPPTPGPPLLLRRIAIINQLPRGVGLDHFDIPLAVFARYSPPSEQHRYRLAVTSARSEVKRWGREIYEYLFEENECGDVEPAGRLAALLYFQSLLEVVASHREGRYLLVPISGTPMIKGGRFHFDFDPVLLELQDLEVKNVKRCPVCSNYFWSGRSDKSCCDRTCAKTETNKRQWKKGDEKRRQRKENEQYKRKRDDLALRRLRK